MGKVKVKTGLVRLYEVRSGPDWSKKVKSGQVTYFKLRSGASV